MRSRLTLAAVMFTFTAETMAEEGAMIADSTELLRLVSVWFRRVLCFWVKHGLHLAR